MPAPTDSAALAVQDFTAILRHTHDAEALAADVCLALQRLTGAAAVALYLGDRARLVERCVATPDGLLGSQLVPGLEHCHTLAARAVRTAGRHAASFSPQTGQVVAVPLRHAAGSLAEPATVGVLCVAMPRSQAMPAWLWRQLDEVAAGLAGALAQEREFHDVIELSLTDPLTGAGNVRQLKRTLHREVERAHRFSRELSVIMLDLDHFKKVNDSYGHSVGDAVLREFSQRLHACVREVDHVLRYGGEEFVVILPETGCAGAQTVAQRIQQRISHQPFDTFDERLRVTVSMGLAAYPQHGDCAAEVLRAADAALYEAKRTGRDRWVVA